MENKTTVVCYYLDIVHDNVLCDGRTFSRQDFIGPSQPWFWGFLSIYVFLVLFAGLVSGLTMGLLSQDTMNLEVLAKSSGPKEQKYASVILKLVSKHHLLLVTLLLANAAAVEAMPIFLNQITSEVVAVVVSITAVLLFGEIIPQALCTRFGLAIGYYCAPLVWVMMAAFFPIAFPLSKLLDCVLGKDHDVFFRRAELRELINIHASNRDGNEEPLTYDEVLIVKSALDMKDKTVKDAMTPIEAVFMLDCNDCIDMHTRDQILLRGYSRIPVCADRKDNIVGMLLVKLLIKLDPTVSTPIHKLQEASIPPPTCLASTPLYNLLNQFQTGKSHLSLVYSDELDENGERKLLGIITLEDVMEELIGEEIFDETDLYVTMQKRVRDEKRLAVDMQRRVAVARAKLAHHRQSLTHIDREESLGSARFARRSQSQTFARNTSARTSLLSIPDKDQEVDPFEGSTPGYGSINS